MSLVIAVDVGVKNLGLCVFDFRTSTVVLWENVPLVPSGCYLPAHNVQYVRNFVRKYDSYFQDAFQIVIERQMRCNMRIIELVLQSMFYDKCTIISARSVKCHYDLSTKNYRGNKLKAVSFVNEFVSKNASAFVTAQLKRYIESKKQDDLADSLIMILYYLDTYSNQLTTGLSEFNADGEF